MITLRLAWGASRETVSLQLPATPGEVGEAFARLDEISRNVEETKIADAVSPVRGLGAYLRGADLSGDDLGKLDCLAEKIGRMTRRERQSFSEALEAEGGKGLDDVLRVADSYGKQRETGPSRRETDLPRVKSVARTFLNLDIQPTDHAPVVVSHPFTNSGFAGIRDAEGKLAIADLLNNPEDLRRWREQVGRHIDLADSAYKVFLLLNKPYMLTFLKHTAPFLSEPDLGRILAGAWTMNETPNMDPNVSKRELADLFRSVSPEYLMDEEELRQYQGLEDTVTVYRGVTSYNGKNIKALSWTLDRDTAEWFAHRFGEEGTVYEAQVRKEHILALFTGRNESEVIVDPRYLEQIMVSPEPGFGMRMT